ncbi:MAG: flagellar basal body rod protein FlgC [Syntrophomonadaceae bacterium]|jgi:flagellar basal-body rod protein FlgC|nr:flagellar basal body rod protein FlgC [Syntrophomonadaceae bacterium]
MKIFHSMNISLSGLTAERLRLDLVASNLANSNTTRTPEGGPFKRRVAVFAERLEQMRGVKGGVQVTAITKDNSPPRMVHDPSHPDANHEGYVAYPNVDVLQEMVDMISAARAYEANVTVFNAGKTMALKAMEIGR